MWPRLHSLAVPTEKLGQNLENPGQYRGKTGVGAIPRSATCKLLGVSLDTHAENAYHHRMTYKAFGEKLKIEREKCGWDQAELATRLGVGQQAVSRWENGGSRPRADVLHKLAALFEDDVNDWLAAAEYKISKPVTPLVAHLPLGELGEEAFELFSCDFVQALNPGVDVHRYGAKGHKQDGIDLYAKTPSGDLDYQCKRHQEFGPTDIDAAVAATTRKALHHHLLLSRLASPRARQAMDKYPDWSLWDIDDISRKVRALPRDEALHIVDTHFPNGWREKFLGIEEPSPWLTPNQFFQVLSDRRRIFNHSWTFVGRDDELKALLQVSRQDGVGAAIVSGRGGIGKSRLLRAWAERAVQVGKVVFLATNTDVSPKDFELLPKGAAILVIDDAHDRSDLLSIAGAVVRLRPHMTLVISTRPYGLTRIQDNLTRAGVGYDADQIVHMGDLQEDDAERLATEVIADAQGDARYARAIAQITKDCPLATVVGSRLVAEGRIAPDLLNNSEQFRAELLRTFRDIIAGEIGGRNAEAVRDLLDLIVMIQPIDPTDPGFREAATRVLNNQRFEKINQDLRALEDAGVLLRRGRRLRVVPDLLADFIRAEVSYDDHNGLPTGYAETVFAAVQNALATNLLINLSQLDWRLSADGVQAALLSEIWSSLERQFAEAKIYGRQAILKAVAKIAYYQPKQALAIAQLAMDDPVEEAEEESGALARRLGVPVSYRTVIDEIAPILRYVAYNTDYLTDALDLLKALAQNDPRPSHRHPEHPVRILRDLASIEPNKPAAYNALIVDHVLTWFDEPASDKFSPFDVLDPILATEGQQAESKGYSLTLKSFLVKPDAVMELRQRVIDAAFQQLLESSLQKSFRAVETINHALEVPHGMGGKHISAVEIEPWEPGIVGTLDRLEYVVATNQLDPFLVVQIRTHMSSHARFDNGATKVAAERVLQALPTTRDYEIARAMADGWGFTFERESSGRRDEERWIQWRDQLAGDLLGEYEHNYPKLIHLLHGYVVRLAEAPIQGKDYSPFLGSLLNQSSNFALALGEYLVADPESPMVGAFGLVISVLAKADYPIAIRLANRAIETGNVVLARATSRAIGWLLPTIAVTKEETAIVNTLAQSPDVAVRCNLVRVVTRYGAENRAAAIDLLLSIRIDDSKDVADEVLGEFGPHGNFTLADLSNDDLEHLDEQLGRCASLEDYNIETFLSNLSSIFPERVVQLLMKRVEYKENQGTEDDESYKPLPHIHGNGLALHFSDTKAYEAMLRKVRNWAAVNTGNWMRAYYGANLFKMVSAGYDEATLEVLREWIVAGEVKKLEAAVELLREAPSDLVFTKSSYVAMTLEHARKHGKACFQRVSSLLFGLAMSGMRSGTPGQPFPRDIEQRDRSYELMVTLSPSSPAYGFYKTLHESAKANIERDTIEDSELE